jgi:hypothetical protein
MRRLFFSALSLLAPACCEVKGPCIPWAKVGETYQVELVQHFENPRNPESTTDPVAYYTSQALTCGQGLDLGLGSIVQMKAARGVGTSTLHSCSCYDIEGRATVHNVSWMTHDGGENGFGDFFFLDQGMATIGDSCQGTYSVAIAPSVSFGSIRMGGEGVATDYVLARKLRVRGDLEPCVTQGSELAGSKVQTCGDAWAVRIRDSAGHVLTHDLSGRPVTISPTDSGPAMDSGW